MFGNVNFLEQEEQTNNTKDFIEPKTIYNSTRLVENKKTNNFIADKKEENFLLQNIDNFFSQLNEVIIFFENTNFYIKNNIDELDQSIISNAQFLKNKIEEYFCKKLIYLKFIQLSLICDEISCFIKYFEELKSYLDYKSLSDQINQLIQNLNTKITEIKNYSEKNNEKTIEQIKNEQKNFVNFYRDKESNFKKNYTKYKIQDLNFDLDKTLELPSEFKIFKNKFENFNQNILRKKQENFENLKNIGNEIINLEVSIKNRVVEEKKVHTNQHRVLRKLLLYILIPLFFISVDVATIIALGKFINIQLSSNIILILTIALIAVSFFIARIIDNEFETGVDSKTIKTKGKVENILGTENTNMIYESYSFLNKVKNFFGF